MKLFKSIGKWFKDVGKWFKKSFHKLGKKVKH